jgi:hypothetical protein
MNDVIARKVAKSLTGKTYENRLSNERQTKKLEYFRTCPGCRLEIGYVHEFTRNRANKQNTVCNSCSSRLYKKSWSYVIKDEHVKKMAAKRAGYASFEQYMAELPKKKQYIREVRRITNQQPLWTLPNADKLIGLCGVDGAYQLDHIISIDEGFKKGLPPSQIGHISNLQYIPWAENRAKWNK